MGTLPKPLAACPDEGVLTPVLHFLRFLPCPSVIMGDGACQGGGAVHASRPRHLKGWDAGRAPGCACVGDDEEKGRKGEYDQQCSTLLS